MDYIDEIKINDKILINPNDIANAFNNYFNNSTNIISTNQIPSDTFVNVNRAANSMFLMPMLENEVRKEVISLKNTNSEGYDEISTKIIKACIDIILPILTHLINLSFTTGTFPEALKLAIVKPLHKKESKTEMSNYRPITLIPVLSKVFEKCFYIRLFGYLHKYNILNKDQYGFQKNKSTTLAMFSLIDSIVTNLNAKKYTTGIFVDLTKAFDFVSHSILLRKLEAIKIRGLTLNWIDSYLSNRLQYVSITKIDKNSTF
ncbi:reverse transcriptase (RNA-dependent DNA polymerase) domain-containing protein [Phthorimaea operculella]|nr:reverse transcriptase (RNA-dependent DNA polymerase) domain-containing protein [Phthorimaea operculella]